jgi:hypothetical protein
MAEPLDLSEQQIVPPPLALPLPLLHAPHGPGIH